MVGIKIKYLEHDRRENRLNTAMHFSVSVLGFLGSHTILVSYATLSMSQNRL